MFAHKFAIPLLAGIAVAAAALPVTPAAAQSGPLPEHRVVAAKKKPAAAPNQVVVARRAPTRVTVRGRSYLDPGTETRTHDEHSMDYAFPPGGNQTFTADPNNPAMNWTRRPFPDCFDLAGFCQPF
jgi:hypothetical protein